MFNSLINKSIILLYKKSNHFINFFRDISFKTAMVKLASPIDYFPTDFFHFIVGNRKFVLFFIIYVYKR